MDGNDSEPIWQPEPIERREASGIFDAVVGVLTAGLGGLVAFVYLAVPMRVSGATHSARLRWQQRQHEINQKIQSSDSNERGSVDPGAPAQPSDSQS